VAAFSVNRFGFSVRLLDIFTRMTTEKYIENPREKILEFSFFTCDGPEKEYYF